MAKQRGSTVVKRAGTRKKTAPARKGTPDKIAKVTDAVQTKVEQIVFDWVAENFGIGEARSPSWNINELAHAVASGLVHGHTAQCEVSYED